MSRPRGRGQCECGGEDGVRRDPACPPRQGCDHAPSRRGVRPGRIDSANRFDLTISVSRRDGQEPEMSVIHLRRAAVTRPRGPKSRAGPRHPVLLFEEDPTGEEPGSGSTRSPSRHLRAGPGERSRPRNFSIIGVGAQYVTENHDPPAHLRRRSAEPVAAGYGPGHRAQAGFTRPVPDATCMAVHACCADDVCARSVEAAYRTGSIPITLIGMGVGGGGPEELRMR